MKVEQPAPLGWFKVETPMIPEGVDPTAFGDEVAGRVRQWYEANRERFLDRHRFLGRDPDGAGTHADEFMLRFITEVDKAREFIRIGMRR